MVRWTGANARVHEEITEHALEVAWREKDADKNVEVGAEAMGPATATESLREASALGADSATTQSTDLL